MIQLNGDQVALLNAAFARVAKDEHHFYPVDPALDEIAKAMGAIQYNIYHEGPRGEKRRKLRFDFTIGSIELDVGDQPELFRPTQPTPEDDGPSGTPIAMAA